MAAAGTSEPSSIDFVDAPDYDDEVWDESGEDDEAHEDDDEEDEDDDEDAELQMWPLHVLARRGDVGQLHFFLAHGADVEKRNLRQSTALHVAAFFGQTKCLHLLLAAGASVHAFDQWQMTALHVASFKGDARCVRALIAAGSDLESASHFGSTPFTCALSLGKRRVLKILLRAGAHVNTANLRRNGLQYPDKFDSWKLVDAVRKAEGWANYVARRRAIGAGAVSKATKGALPHVINVEILAFVEPPGGS